MRTFFISCVLLLLLTVPAQAKLLSADQVREPQSLLPYCTWLPDPEMRHSIASVTSGASPERFAPLRGGLSLRGSGPVWVRLVLVKSATTEMPLVINLGDLPPGKTTVYFAQSSGQLGETPGENWRSVDVSSHENIPLPEPGLLPESVYIHMEEMPGLWFTPMVSAQNAAPSGMRLSAIILPVVLVLALGLCLLKGIKEQVQWALWAALYLLFALVSAVFTVPGAHYAFGFLNLPVLLAPGLALILLPHVGRCMFRTPGESLVQDTILYFCSFLGMVVALAPLFPGMGWLTRLFPLWPIVLLPLLPLCLGAVVMKRPGAFAYSGACLFPVLGAVASLAVMRSPSPHPFAAQGGLWGVALGGLGLVLARVPKYIPAVHDVDDEFMEPELAGLSLAESAVGSARAKAADSGLDLDETDAFRKHSQYEDLPPLQVQTLSDAASTHHAASELAFGGFDGIRPAGAEDGPVLSGGAGITEQVSHAPHAVSGIPQGAMAQGFAQGDAAYVPGGAHDDAHGDAHGAAYGEQPESDGDGTADNGYGGYAAPADFAARGDYAKAQEHEAADPADFASAGMDHDEYQERHVSAEADREPVTQDVTQQHSEPHAHGEGFAEAAARNLSAQTAQAYYGGESSLSSDADDQLLSLVEEEETPSFSLPPEAPSLGTDILDDDDERMSARTAFPTQTGFVFNLHALVRGVHDIVAPLAKNKGIIFSWFISPSLPPLLEGDAPRLRGALTLLLQNAVQATRRGSVQLAVRKNPGGTERGDLLFAVSDSGSVQRTDAGFFHAWEMAARTGGVFNVEYSPNSGTQITFTVRFGLPSRQEAMAAGLGSSAALGVPGATGVPGAPTFRSSQERDAEAMARSAMQEAQRTDAQAAQTTATDFAYPAEDPRLAAMTPEEVLAEQDFLEPPAEGASTVQEADTAQHDPQAQERQERQDSGAGREEAVLYEQAPVHTSPENAFAGAPLAAAAKVSAAKAPTGAKRLPRIAVAEMTTSNRRLLSSYLSDLPHEHLNAAGNAQVLEMAKTSPLALIVFDGDMPEQDIVRTITALRAEENGSGRAPVPTLVLTAHESQSERMLEQGASYVLEKPYSQKSLRALVALAVPGLAEAVRRAPGEERADSALPGLPSGLLERHIAAVQAAAASEAAALKETQSEKEEAAAEDELVEEAAPEEVAAEEVAAAEGADEEAAAAEGADVETQEQPDPSVAQEQGLFAAKPDEGFAEEAEYSGSVEDAAEEFAAAGADDVAAAQSFATGDEAAPEATADAPAEAEAAATSVFEEAEAASFDVAPDAFPDAHVSEFADEPEHAAEAMATETIEEAEAEAAGADQDLAGHFLSEPLSTAKEGTDATRFAHPVEKMLADDLLFAPAEEEAEPAPAALDAEPDVTLDATSDALSDASQETASEEESVFDATAVFATDEDSDIKAEEAETAEADETDRQLEPEAAPLAEEQPEAAPEAFTDVVFAQPVMEDGAFADEDAGQQPEARLQDEAQAEPVAEAQPEPVAEAQPEPVAETQPEPVAEPVAEAPQVSPLASFDAFVTDVDPDALAEDVPDFGEVVFRDTPTDETTGPVAAVVHEDGPEMARGPRSSFAAKEGFFKETDVLEAALRDAPKQQGKVVEVSLPPRHGVSSTLPADLGGGEAAPILQGLSKADVTPDFGPAASPATSSASAPASAAGQHEGDGALLDFILPDEEGEAAAEHAAREARFPLPGIAGEFLNAADLPLTPGVIHSLQDALGDMNSGLAQEKSIIVQEAASRLAGKAENFGLDKLGKIARCVERAAQAGDMEAVGTLMDDLVPVVERYVNSLHDCFQSFLSLER